MIIDDVLTAMEEGRSPILLTERKEHRGLLHQRLKRFVRHIVALRGGRSSKERREVQEQLESIPASEERLILATGRYIGEGFDDARPDTLFLALPVCSSSHRLNCSLTPFLFVKKVFIFSGSLFGTASFLPNHTWL